ncbi:MAG: hypothetical protein IPO55_06110 [Alphaproteobacteria bacterium]|nr:hypothetical protein [Alphaproteobacteria bacterium]
MEKTDRLYRNIKDWVTLDELGLEIHFAKRRDPERGPFFGKIHARYQSSHGEELYRQSFRRKRAKVWQKSRQGIWPSKAPLGYLNITTEEGKK